MASAENNNAASPPATGYELEQRHRLERALIELVVEAGYEGLSEAAVAERAGLDLETFQANFKDTRHCLEQVWEEMTDLHIAVVRRAAASEESWRDGLRAAAYAALRFHTEDEIRAQFFLIEALAAGEFAQARRDLMMEAFVELIDEGRQCSADPGSISRATAEGVAGAIYEAAVSGMRRTGTTSAAELVPQLMYLAVRPYEGQDAAEQELRRGPDDIATFQNAGGAL